MICCNSKDQFSNTILKSVFNRPTRKTIDHLANYLLDISGKELKTNFIRQFLFKTKWSEKDILILNRSHLQAASIYLQYLNTRQKTLDEEEVKIVIADICKYVEVIDPNQNTSFIVVSTNTLPSLIHYRQAESIFYHHELPPDSKRNYDYDLLVLYALRLSLEKRVNGILGIDHIRNKNQRIGLSRLLKIVKSLSYMEYSSNINWDEIEWVNNWLNHHMHRHIRPYPWIIHQAFEVLNSILKSSEYKHGERVIHSLYASTAVKDIEVLKKEFLEKLYEIYPEAVVYWSNSPEVLKLK